MKEHIAEFTVEVHVRFKFKARESVERELLYKMAEAYTELAFASGRFDYDDKDINVVDKKIEYTPEERAEINRKLDEMFGGGNL